MVKRHVRRFLNISALESVVVFFGYLVLVYFLINSGATKEITKLWPPFDSYFWPIVMIIFFLLFIIMALKVRKEFGGGEYTEVYRHKRW